MLKEIRNKIDMKYINLIHVTAISTTLMYIGKYQNNSHQYAFNLLGILASAIVLLVSLPNGFTGYWNLIKIIHYAILLPSLLYIAYKRDFSIQTYEGIFNTGVIVFLYHAYKFGSNFNYNELINYLQIIYPILLLLILLIYYCYNYLLISSNLF